MKKLTQQEIEKIRAEILAKCELVGDCWVYRGYINQDGYGMKKIGKVLHSVHRLMLALRDGCSCMYDGFTMCRCRESPSPAAAAALSRGGMGTATSSTINVGTFVLDMYDPTTKQLVWTGQGHQDDRPEFEPGKEPEESG